MHNSNQFPVAHKGAGVSNPLHLSPEDSAKRGLTEGEPVLVNSNFGQIDAVICIDSSLMKGTAAMTHGYGESEIGEGVNCNYLLPSGPDSYDRYSNQAFMSGIPIQVVKRV